jgi:glyoxylate/hydroxypyruvate reductase
MSALPQCKHVTFAQLPNILPTTDVLVCLLPLTESTRGIIAQPLLQQLKHGATIVNAGRGAHVVENDLVEALESGTLWYALHLARTRAFKH